jgi:hypothetical protein
MAYEAPPAPQINDNLFTKLDNYEQRIRVLERQGSTPVAPPDTEGEDKNYVHIQSSPSAAWSVVHNLEKYPAVDVVDSGGTAIIPDVHYVDTNNLTVNFGSATSGKAFVN